MRLHLICIWVACAVLYGSGCAPKSNLSPDLESNGQAPQGHDIETIAILGTNDLHGVIAPQTLKTRELDGVIPIEYQAGGISYLASYVKILRSEFGRNLIWLDAGDEFQGSIESNQEQGRPLVTFFNQTGLHAAAIGNHEFDFGLDALKERMLEAQYPYLGANILSKNSNRLANKELPHLKSHALIDAGRIKVGVIGLSTIETPQTTRSVYVQDLDFGDAKEATLREAAEVRKAGADIVIAVAHVGLKGEKGASLLSATFENQRIPKETAGLATSW